MLTDKEKDEAIKLSQEISKYAFATAFFASYNKSEAEQHHCKENLKRTMKELLELIEK